MTSNDKKYSPRSMPMITRESYDVEKQEKAPSWMQEFVSNFQKESVKSKDNANKSIYDQISSIMGNKSKHATVDAAVDDMKQRSGMKDFLDKMQSQGGDVGQKKNANCDHCDEKCGHGDTKEIIIFKNVPQIKDTVDNYVQDTRGNISLPAIVEKIKSIHRNDVVEDGDWDDEEFLRYINDRNVDLKKMYQDHSTQNKNLGKTYQDTETDSSNSDAFHGLMPAVVSK